MERNHENKGFKESFKDTRVSEKVLRILEYVDLNYTREISLRDTASQFGIHHQYLCRKFKKEIGISFRKYILIIRIQKASALLVKSNKSIKEIGFEVGFKRPEVFSKAFKQWRGCSPKEYRIRKNAKRRC